MNFRVLTLLASSLFWCLSALQAEDNLWTGNKLTPAQPFPAKVSAVAQSWVGYDLLLDEIGGARRQCIVRVWVSVPSLEYITLDSAKGETSEWPRRTQGGWTYITPGIEVDQFSWSVGVYKIGKVFRDEDILLKITTPKKEPSQ
ncbi:hypothetical protein ACXR0O_23465 [Verrucomicrobiota bacterium sgz303538]